jgi:ubiquinone/menaquinone biosynthesis C-methylase UbiE
VLSTPNAQFNFAKPDSLAMSVAARVRAEMFRMFMREFSPTASDYVLDMGVTSDQTYSASNYFEEFYPHKDRMVAGGIQDASFLETRYPGTRYIQADALKMPFADDSFDLVHSSAVLEHVGGSANQARMISECLRVARRGICLTTPNRWFPIEFHTQLPLIHWLPKPMFRSMLVKLGFGPLAEEKNLNLMTARELQSMTASITGWHLRVAFAYLWGMPSNLILFGRRI